MTNDNHIEDERDLHPIIQEDRRRAREFHAFYLKIQQMFADSRARYQGRKLRVVK